MTNEKILSEYNSIIKNRKWRRVMGLLFSLACIGFGIAGFWVDSIASIIGQVEFHRVCFFIGAGALGANMSNKYGKEEMALLRVVMNKLDIDDHGATTNKAK